MLLTTQQVCEELNISRVSLWRLTKDGQLKTVRLGRRCVRISRDELRAFVGRIEALQEKRRLVDGFRGQ